MSSLESQSSQPQYADFGSYKRFEERLDLMSGRIEELTKMINLKTDRLMVKIRTIEERQEEMTQDFQKRLMSLLSKAADMPKIELKVQDLFERYSQSIRSLESQILRMRKAAENHDLQIRQMSIDLEDSRRELAKLRRG